MARLAVDDLYRCTACGGWHPLYVKYPSGSTDDEAKRLYFDCPHAPGTFYAGRIGEPPNDVSRWSRA